MTEFHDRITDEERQLIASYSGPVTICPPLTFSPPPDSDTPVNQRDWTRAGRIQRVREGRKVYFDTLRADRRARLLHMIRQAFPLEEMAKRLGITPNAVSMSMRRLNLRHLLAK